MKKEEFLRELETLLAALSESERAEAMQYYRDYIDDAGPEMEAEIMEELGSPIRVARIIKEGLRENEGEFSERRYRDGRFEQERELKRREGSREYGQGSREYGQGSREYGREAFRGRGQRTGQNGWKLACIFLLCVLLFPAILPVGVCVLALLLAIPIILLAVWAAMGIFALAFLIGGAGVAAVGFFNIFLLPSAGIALAGVGCLLLAVGALALLAVAWCACKIFPVFIRGIVQLLEYPFRGRREAGQV